MCLSLNSWNSNLALPETVSGSSVLRRGANVPSCQGSMDWQMDQERWDFSLKILDKGLLLGNIVTWLSNLELTQWEGFALQLTTQIFITSSHCVHARTHRHTHTLYIARATVAKSHRLKQHRCIFHSSRGWSPWSRCLQGWSVLRALPLACKWLPSLHVLTWPFLCCEHPWCLVVCPNAFL